MPWTETARRDYPRNRKGVITQQRVTDILTQPIYTGYICSERYGLNWLKGHHEPLISVETFQKVQDRRAGGAKAPKRASIRDDFVLRLRLLRWLRRAAAVVLSEGPYQALCLLPVPDEDLRRLLKVHLARQDRGRGR